MKSYLMHHGILGQKWGVRRYQNKDGSLTDAGRKHYGYAAEELSKHLKQTKENAEYYKEANKSFKKKYTGKNGMENYMNHYFGDNWRNEDLSDFGVNVKDPKSIKRFYDEGLKSDMEYNEFDYNFYMSEAKKIETQMNRFMNATNINDLSEKEIKQAEKLVKEYMKDQKRLKKR